MPRAGRRAAPATCASPTSQAPPSGSRRSHARFAPLAIGFVGKIAYTGPFGGGVEHGLQQARLGETALFVLPSTSPANAAVPWDERLRWFSALRDIVS